MLHQDWSLVTETSPAVVGEILHFYVTGLGAVGGSVGDGETTPDSPLLPVIQNPVFSSLSNSGATVDYCSAYGAEFQLMFAGLAPGTVGIYQMDVKLSSVEFNLISLNCGVPSDTRLGSGVLFYAAPPQAGIKANDK